MRADSGVVRRVRADSGKMRAGRGTVVGDDGTREAARVRSIRSVCLAATASNGMNKRLKRLTHGPVGSVGLESEAPAGGTGRDYAGAGR